MSESNLSKFKKLLAELFMFDQADLDFGIYRIMNAKRGEITRFLDNDLLPQVRQSLAELESGDRAQIEGELAKAVEQARELGVDAESTEKVKRLREQIAATTDIEAIESEVFSHLYEFFRRYYSDGDFLSLRRYKAGVYAIPYEGEEVKVHWANADQYYVKTSENFRDYAFKLADGRLVHFKLTDADLETNNNKAANGNERRFIFKHDAPLAEKDGELVISFEYRPDVEKRKQVQLNTEAVAAVLSAEGFLNWTATLAAKAPTEKNKDRTVLEKHLTEFTAKNTFDYFIHKDLGGFLGRELDFYIKNEVMYLDDIESDTAAGVEQYLARIKAMRRIAHKVIDFLAQLENFQKRLWLKKKFIIATNYCITLDRISEELYPLIASNDAQREEWERLFEIENLPDFSVPLTPTFLKDNALLAVDTRFFGDDFKSVVLSSLSDLDEQTDGLLVHTDNFQGLSLLQARYRGSVNCLYIDPPFNTGTNEFLYKNDYLDSSWIQMLVDRVALGRSLLADGGFFFLRIDYHGNQYSRSFLDGIFGKENFRSELNVSRIKKNTTGQGRITLPVATDSLFLYAKTQSAEYTNPFKDLEKTRESYWRRIDDSAGFRNPPERDFFGKTILPPKTDQHFKYSQDSIERMIGQGRIRLKCKSCGYAHRSGSWQGCPECSADDPLPQYLVEESDVQILDSNWTDISGYSSNWGFPTENSEILLKRVIELASKPGALVMDFFLGSGTTAATAQKLNRRWIGVEMGQYWDGIDLRRLKIVVRGDETGIKDYEKRSTIIKYIRLESYEDALNNLEVARSSAQSTLLEQHDKLREDYTLRYMLDVETRGSSSLLNVERFADPFNYKLNVSNGGSAGGNNLVNVDIVETFNYLIGLRVKHIDSIGGFRVVEGGNPDGEKVLIIWRNTTEKSNTDLDQFFQKQAYKTGDTEFDLIYVNGDNNLENLRRTDETWKVRLIEQEFHRLMFDVRDV